MSIQPENIDEKDILPDEGEAYGEVEKKEEPKAEEPVEEKTPASKVRDMLESGKASNKAYLDNQAENYPETVKFDRVQVLVLNLGMKEDVEEYARVKTEAMDPNLGLTLIYEDIQYNDKSDNWKVMLELNHYKFLPIA